MKRLTFTITSIILILLLMLVSSCKKIEEDVVLSDKTKLPEENTDLTNVTVNADTLRFIYKAGATKPKFNPSDIVVGQTGEGYLKKVVSTTTRGDTLILLTEQASLTDAIKKCDVETTFSLTPSSKKMGSIRTDTTFIGKDGKHYRMLLQSEEVIVQPAPEGIEFEIKLPNVRIEVRDDQNNLTAYISCDTVVIRKGIDFDFAIKIESFEIKEFRGIASSTDGINFKTVRLGLERSIFNKEVQQKLMTVPLGQIVVMAGPVPIVFVFEFGVYAGLGVDLTLNLSCEILNNVNLSSTNSVGARYENGSWDPVLEKTLDGNANFNFGPSASLTAELQGFLKGSLDSKVYGIAGPCLYLKPYQYNEVTFPPFDYDLGIGLGAGLGFKVEIFSWLLAEFNWTFADYRMSLIHSTTPTNNPPNTPSTPFGPDTGSVGTSYEFSSSATDPDGDNVAIRFAGGDGDTSNWSSYVPSGQTVTISHSWSTAGTYYVKAQAKDVNGATSNWSSVHQIIISGSGNEMVLNPGFENDFEYWGGNNGFSIFSTNPGSGLKCAGILFGRTGYFDRGLNSDSYLRLQQGRTYRFSIWVREKDTHDTYDPLKTIFDIGVVINGTYYAMYGDSTTHTQSETWKLIERYFTPTETDTTAQISIQIHGYSTSSEAVAAVDDVSIKEAEK